VTAREGEEVKEVLGAWCMGFGARRAPLQAGHGQRHKAQGTKHQARGAAAPYREMIFEMAAANFRKLSK
jgi:hypothetical protein